MGSRKSIIREAIERLDSLMAIGQSRFQAKQAKRTASAEAGWTVSTGRIHSHTTRKVYQQHILAFINWARTNHGITRLASLDQRADELVTQYLTEHVVTDRSAYTVQTERAEVFNGTKELTEGVKYAPIGLPVMLVCMLFGRARSVPPSCQLSSPFLLSRFSSLLASSPLITVGATRLLAGSGSPPLGEDLQRRHSDRTNWRKDLSREGGACHIDVPKRLDYRPDHPSRLCSGV
jgi:hypothetical protein